jgi:hypothetical protein
MVALALRLAFTEVLDRLIGLGISVEVKVDDFPVLCRFLPSRFIPHYASQNPTLCVNNPRLCVNLQLSGIQVLHNARVVFDEVASRLNIPAHKLGEDGFYLPLSLDHPSFVRTHKKD